MAEVSSFWARLSSGLSGARQKIAAGLSNMAAGKIDAGSLEELEEILVASDVGIKVSSQLIRRLQARRGEAKDLPGLQMILRQEMLGILNSVPSCPFDGQPRPQIMMLVGVNGVGKTTTIAKLAHLFKSQGKSVLLGAGDTFRAAAVEQLLIWGSRLGCPVVRQKSGADPSGVAFNMVEAALEQQFDLALLDTAGRLHTKANLMEELKKMHRVMGKRLPGAPHKVLLTLDATTGQNAVNQARLFHQATPLSGFILTKMDGSAKGGVALGLSGELKLPVCFIGQGENLEDLKPFSPRDFVQAIV
jgi:fused signal recognition particle receptor